MTPKTSLVQEWIAFTSAGPSTVRGYPTGTLSAIREAVNAVSLSAVAECGEAGFVVMLNDETDRIRATLSKDKTQEFWGLSRKVLNIFLRGATYNAFLRERFRLDTIERLLEIPLDSYSAKALILETGKRHLEPRLPGWRGINHLNADSNRQFQDRAIEIAQQEGTLRVHLDMEFWMKGIRRKENG